MKKCRYCGSKYETQIEMDKCEKICQRRTTRKYLLMSAMLRMKGKYIATCEEIAEVVKQIAIENFDFRAKSELDKIDFKTDKDIYEAMNEYWPERGIEDPDGIKYNNIPIFTS
jgi:hypothetical protein